MGIGSGRVTATLLLMLLAGCARQPTPSEVKNAALTSKVGVATTALPATGLEAGAEEQGEEKQSEEEQSAATLLNPESDCKVEIDAAEKALADAKFNPSTGQHVDYKFPFDRRIRNGCGVFPADYLEEDADDNEETSQCNRVLLAKALIECINWDLPVLPEKMQSSGLQLKVVEAELYESLKRKARSKDWFGFLADMDARFKKRSGETQIALMTEFPSYGRIEYLVDEVPTFTVLLGGDFSKYPELVGDEFMFFICGGSASPCGGYLKQDVKPFKVEQMLLAVGRSCASNGIVARSDGEGWVMRPYKFDTCKYLIVPIAHYLNRVEKPTGFDELIAEERVKFLQRISFREISVDDARSQLLSAYDRYVDVAQQAVMEEQERFSSDLERARSNRAVRVENRQE